MKPELHAFHLEAPGGFRFCVLRSPPPGVASLGGIVHVPAFAEEMNKSRHMAALQAEAWATQGWTVLQIDLHGCGDSSGEFADASWESWLQDVRLACERLEGLGVPLRWLWGLRLGALLACDALERFSLGCGLLLWQPVTGGGQHLQQFLRLWKMAQVVGKGAAGPAPDELLAAGGVAEVAGYELSPRLAAGMRQAALHAVAAAAVHWFQVGAGQPDPSPAFLKLAERWRSLGVPVCHHGVEGPGFWQTQEISLAPALLRASLAAIADRDCEVSA